MRFEAATIPLVPRTTSNCLDLASVFVRRYWQPIAAQWCTVAIPASVLTYVLVDRYECTLLTALVVFFIATSPLGIMLTAGAAPCAFGEEFTYRGAWSRLGWKGARLFVIGFLWRIVAGFALMLLIVPGWYVVVRTGFFVEQAVLSSLARHLHDRRTDELLKGEMSELFVRSGQISIFCLLVWLVLLLTVDALSSNLLGLPILWGRMHVDLQYLEDSGEALSYFFHFLWSDPVVVTAALAVAFVIYVVGRLAWFLCYVDARVRRDCWDMDLRISQEAQRLEGS